MMKVDLLSNVDPDVYNAIRCEQERQQSNLELIASENFTSPAVMAAAGSVMTNKYAEGYPGHRYYGGCEFVDRVEELAISRAKQLFNAEFVNVQPHSGSQANMASLFTLLQPGDLILSMNLAHGGHLTHGSPVSFSGRLFQIVHYGVNPETETVDYDEVRRLAHERRPKLILAGASAYPRTLDFERFAEIAREIRAFFMVDMAHIAGLVAAGLHPSPVPTADLVTTTTHKTLRGPRGGVILGKPEHAKKVNSAVFPGFQGGPLMHIIAAKAVAFQEALQPQFNVYQKQVTANAKRLADALKTAGFRLVGGGTDTHMILINLIGRDLTGLEAEKALERAGITVNKNIVPFDPQPPNVTSGLRLGTPALTTRGMTEAEMDLVAEYIAEAVIHREDHAYLASIREKVVALCGRFPLYQE